jgi:hypothetical protein
MTDHVITVRLSSTGRKLIADPGQNPLGVAGGDTVTWDVFDPGGQVIQVQVRFVSFVPDQPPGLGRGNSPFDPNQPAGTIDPNAERGLYLYALVDSGGNVLDWETPLFMVGGGSPAHFSALLAGIVKPMGPPP